MIFEQYSSPTLVRGITTGTESSNGAGKSSVFEGLFWCLTGKTIRGVRAADVIHTGTKQATVNACFEARGKQYRVQRSYSTKKKELVFWEDGEEQRFHDAKQGTEALFEHLNISAETFSGACFNGRSFTTFSQLSPKERSDIIDQLAEGTMYEELRVVEATKAKELKQETEAKQEQLNTLAGKKQSCQEEIQEYDKQIQESKNLVAESLAEAIRKRQDAEQELSDAKEKLQEVQKEGEKIPGSSDLVKKVENVQAEIRVLEKGCREILDSYETQEKELKKEANAMLQTATALETEDNQIEERLTQIEQGFDKGSCYACGQELEQESTKKLAQEAEELIARSDDLNKQKVSILEQVSVVEQKCINVSEEKQKDELLLQAKKQIEGLQEDARVLQKQLAENDAKLREQNQKERGMHTKVEEAQTQVAKTSKSVESLQNDSREKQLQSTKALRMKDLQGYEDEYVRIQDSLKQSLENLVLAKYWATGFKDIRFSRFEHVVKILEELLNAFCKKQGLEFDKVEVTSFKETASSGVRPSIDIHVFRKNEKISLDGLSEGETQRVNLACFFALASLLEKHCGCPLILKVLDEPLTGLDYQGKKAVFEVISELSEDHQVFVVDHEAAFNELFESILTVEKEDGASKIA